MKYSIRLDAEEWEQIVTVLEQYWRLNPDDTDVKDAYLCLHREVELHAETWTL